MSFVSSKELSKSREIKRKLQKDALTSAKAKFEKQEEISQQKKENRQNNWLTSSLESRLNKDEFKHKKQHKTKKKHKKHKKKSKRKQSSSSDDSSEESNWIEKSTEESQTDEWMKQDFLSGIKTVSSKEIKEQEEQRNRRKDNIPKSLSCFDSPGQHSKELNPFWKSGNKGLPTNDAATSNVSSVPDVTWLERSLTRMQEQSNESGRSIESIASDRYGSWQAFQDLLTRARKKSGRYTRESSPSGKRRFMKPSDGGHSRSTSHSKSSSADTARWKKKKTITHVEEKKLEMTISKPEPDAIKDVVSSPAKDINQKTDSRKLPKILSEEEKNVIGAKIIKAEIIGNQALIDKLKKRLTDSKEAEGIQERKSSHNVAPTGKAHNLEVEGDQSSSSSSDTSSSDEETVVLTRTNKSGQSWPVTESEYYLPPTKKKKNKKVKVHDEDGNRAKYFADDDKYTLRDLVEQERIGDSEDQTQTLSRLSGKLFVKPDGDNFTLDDMFESEASGMLSTNTSDQSRKKAIASHNKLMRRLEKCKFCFGNPENPKHLIMAIGRVAYIKLPSHCVLQDGHCLICPMHHCATGTNLDEDVWEEIRKFMRSLCNMFLKQNKDCIFLQTCLGLKHSPHFSIECVPMPVEIGELAPIYFKKAIQECESEWTQNKKLIDTRGKNIKDKIPAGLPYFSVEFGTSGGFAHVVEDEQVFPKYFGREVLGGMLDADPNLWRKPKEERFNEQMKRSIEFEKVFKTFDWTKTEIV